MINRPKMGFSVPVAKWLRGELKEWAEDLLASIDTHNDGMLQKELVQKTWSEHASGKRDHSHRLWTVLMYLSWRERS
jgi:asparagine synthase (glutamine-hydrolysing)